MKMISRTKIWTAAFMILLLLVNVGCASDKPSGADTAGGGLRILTSFYPIYIATINIARDVPGVNVSNMTEQSQGCLHDYSLKTSDMKKLEKTDIFVINGAGMESFIQKAIDQKPGLQVLDSGKGIGLLKDSKTGEDNPHVWVSITGAIEQAENIGKQLAEMDSAHAGEYAKNAETYVKKLEALRQEMHSRLDGLKNRNIVTFHEAFPYFAKEFNLTIKAVIERDPNTEPSPQELANTIDIVRSAGVKALFAEPQYSQKAADSIAKETGAKVYTLDPVATGEANDDYDAYIKTMKLNLKTLEEALGANGQ